MDSRFSRGPSLFAEASVGWSTRESVVRWWRISLFLRISICPAAMKPPRTKPSLLFRLIVPVTVVFIFTILALIASVFGDPKAPVSIWLETHGNTLLFWEFIAVVAMSLLAMTIDRVRILTGRDEELMAETPATENVPSGSDSV